MPHLPFHPAPGFGDLSPGWFVVPQNPIRTDGTPLVPSVQATAPGRVVKLPALADLVAASFAVPQNPLIPSRGGMGCAGMGCGGNNVYALNGLGDDAGGITAWLTAPSFVSDSVPNWALYGGAAVAAYLIFAPGGSEYRSKSRALRSQYRGYRRAGQALAENPRSRRNVQGFIDGSGFHPIRASSDYNQDRAEDPELYRRKRRKVKVSRRRKK